MTSALLALRRLLTDAGGVPYAQEVNQSASPCPACGRLNGSTESRCHRCQAQVTGPQATLARAFGAKNFATKVLIGLCVFNFVLLLMMNGAVPWGLFDAPAGRQAALRAGGVTGLLTLVQPWRLLSAVFVHLSVLHLGVNLYALASFGPSFESRFGGARLVLVFATTGVAGFLTSSYLYAWSGPLTAGASGALFGLIGCEVGFLAIRRDPRAREVLIQYLIIAMALGLMMPVNNFAHLGGFVMGLFFGAGLARSNTLT